MNSANIGANPRTSASAKYVGSTSNLEMRDKQTIQDEIDAINAEVKILKLTALGALAQQKGDDELINKTLNEIDLAKKSLDEEAMRLALDAVENALKTLKNDRLNDIGSNIRMTESLKHVEGASSNLEAQNRSFSLESEVKTLRAVLSALYQQYDDDNKLITALLTRIDLAKNLATKNGNAEPISLALDAIKPRFALLRNTNTVDKPVSTFIPTV